MCETVNLITQIAACPGKNFKEIIFVVEAKSTKTAKFIVLENLPLYSIYVATYCYFIMSATILTCALRSYSYLLVVYSKHSS